MHAGNNWQTGSTSPDIPNRAKREKSRVTLQLNQNEKAALDWLSRIPNGHEENLPKRFKPLARKAARTIAKDLSGQELTNLVTAWQQRSKSQPTEL